MKEVLEALAPWPVIQGIVIGLIIAGIGVWAMLRGLQDRQKKPDPGVEDLQARWEMQQAIAHMHENSFEIVKLLEKQNDIGERMLAAINRLADSHWNRSQ
jgi:hypothetical protein